MECRIHNISGNCEVPTFCIFCSLFLATSCMISVSCLYNLNQEKQNHCFCTKIINNGNIRGVLRMKYQFYRRLSFLQKQPLTRWIYNPLEWNDWRYMGGLTFTWIYFRKLSTIFRILKSAEIKEGTEWTVNNTVRFTIPTNKNLLKIFKKLKIVITSFEISTSCSKGTGNFN